MKTKYPTFKKGQTVKWESQASGFKKKKAGRIVGVVLSFSRPDYRYGKVLFEYSTWHRFTARRDHKSYVVNVNGKLYWPLVKYLKLKQ